MNYLTLDMIKKQCVIDPDYHGDDEFLTMVGDTAENMVEQLVNCPLDEIAALNDGDMPAVLMHAMRMLADYYYAVERGSSDTEKEIPNAVMTMIKLYRKFT